jgi:hypothetical protein
MAQAQATVLQEINGLYVALYGRAADGPGLNYWVSLLSAHDPAVTSANASTLALSAADAMYLGQQFVNTQSSYFNTQYGGLTDSQFVQALYVNVGGNTGNAAGIAYWLNLLTAAEASGQTAQNARAGLVGQFAHDMLSIDLTVGAAALGLSASDYAAAVARQQQFQNKELVSQNYAIESSLPGLGGAANVLLAPMTSSAGFAAAINAIPGVTSDVATVTAAETAIAASVVAGNLNAIMALPSQIFTVDATAIAAANSTSSPVVVQTPASGNVIINVQSTNVLKAAAGIQASGNANTTVNYAFNGGGAGETLFLSGSGNNVINFIGTTTVPVSGDAVVGGSGTTTINANNVTLVVGESWIGFGGSTHNILNVFGTDDFSLGKIANFQTVTMHSTAKFTTTEVAGFNSITEVAGGVGSLTILGDGITNSVNLTGELSGITTLVVNGNGHVTYVTLGASDLIGVTSVTETGGGLIITTVAGALELLAINPNLHYALSDTAADIAAASAAVLANSTNYAPSHLVLTVASETIALNGTTGTITLSGADLTAYPAASYGTVALAAAAGITSVTGDQTTLSAAGNAHATTYNFGTGIVSGADTVDGTLIYTGITTYVASNHGDAVTLSAATQNVTGGTGGDTVNFASLTATGTVALGSGANIVQVNGADISGLTYSDAGTAALHITSSGTNNETMTAAEYNDFNATGISITGTATAAQTTITFSNAGTVTINGNVGNYNLTGSLTINAGLGINTIMFAGSANDIINQGGTDTLIDTGTDNTIALPLAGQGLDTIHGAVLANGDTFNLRAALAGTTWDQQLSDLGNYLTLGTSGSNTLVQLSVTSGGTPITVAILVGQGSVSLSTFEAHALLT